MDRINIVRTSAGIYTDVWLDGRYSRLPYECHAGTAFQLVRQMRKRLAA